MIFCDIHTHHIPVVETQNIRIINRIIGKDHFPEPVWDAHFWSVGIHPWYPEDSQQQWQQLQELAKQKNVLAIGEAGLDKLAVLTMPEQIELFRKQAFLSEEVHRPLVIHCVKAWDELLSIRKEIKPSVPWLIHGFRGNYQQAEQLLKHGFLLSFGIHFHPESVQAAWPESLFLETDDKEVFIEAVYGKVKDAIGVSLEELTLQIRKNVAQIFSV